MTEEQGSRRFPTARSLKVEDLIQVYDGIIADADEVLKESNIAGPLPTPGLPEGVEAYLKWTDHNDPLPPDDITAVDDLTLGKMFSLFQNWTNYVASQVTRAKAIRDGQERNLKVVKSALAIFYREERGVAASMISDYVNVDERYVEVDASVLRIKVFYETSSSREDQLRRTLNNISREQTRRRDELERTLHDEWGGREPKPPSGPRGPRARDRGFSR